MDRFLFLSLVNLVHMHFSTQCELTLRCCVPCDLQQCVQTKTIQEYLDKNSANERFSQILFVVRLSRIKLDSISIMNSAGQIT